MEVWCKDRASTAMVRPRAIQEGVWVNHRRCLDEGADIGRVYGPQGRTSTVHPIWFDQIPGSA